MHISVSETHLVNWRSQYLRCLKGDKNDRNKIFKIYKYSYSDQTTSNNFMLSSKPLSLTQVYVSEVLENVLMSAESIAQNKEIELEVEISSNLKPVWGNVSALREVCSNLIDNGIKYTPSSGKLELN